MPMDFKSAKTNIINALTNSKLSALAPIVERATLTTNYTNWQYSQHPDSYIQTNEEWVAALLLCFGYGVLDEFPTRHPALPSGLIETPEPVPFMLVPSAIPDVYTYRKVDYNSDIIKATIVRYLQ